MKNIWGWFFLQLKGRMKTAHNWAENPPTRIASAAKNPSSSSQLGDVVQYQLPLELDLTCTDILICWPGLILDRSTGGLRWLNEPIWATEHTIGKIYDEHLWCSWLSKLVCITVHLPAQQGNVGWIIYVAEFIRDACSVKPQNPDVSTHVARVVLPQLSPLYGRGDMRGVSPCVEKTI